MPPETDDLLSRTVLAAEVAGRLSIDILTLKMQPGTRVIEDDVSRRFGISRSPVREAMRMLDADGLTVRSPRRGCIVAPMSAADLEHVYACRLVLEPLAAAGAAERADTASITALQLHWGNMRRARDAGDARAAFLANMAMTDLLHAQCGNPVLSRLLSTLDKQGLRYRFVAYRQSAAFLSASVEENATLIATIAARDPASAKAITERLIATALRTLREHVPAGILGMQDEAA
jgi:DNA-binding GntR family transcriptional regulator